MQIISAELSGNSKAIAAMTTRTEGYASSQGQSVGGAIIHPRGRAISNGDEKVRRYSSESMRSEIINSVQHLDMIYGCKIIDDSDNIKGVKFTNVD
jgi:hypothetical protein|tara:strand:+ start:867 stop:1154 length:288 start_codon:yes stop_codon:yes gene_type:complete